MTIYNFESAVRLLKSRYNPEADTPGPHCNPAVSINEMHLLGMIEILQVEIVKLEKRIHAMEENQVCKECEEHAFLSAVHLCPDCTEKWVKNR